MSAGDGYRYGDGDVDTAVRSPPGAPGHPQVEGRGAERGDWRVPSAGGWSDLTVNLTVTREEAVLQGSRQNCVIILYRCWRSVARAEERN